MAMPADKHNPSRISDDNVAGSPFASAAATTASAMAKAPEDSKIFAGRHPGVNPFDPTTPVGNPPPLAPNSAYTP